MTVTVNVDLRSLFGPCRNQGARNTCVAFAASDAHAAVRGTYVPLSPEHLHFHTVKRIPGGHPANGVPFGTALKALELDGQCVEIGWPYVNSLPTDIALWLPPATAMPVFVAPSTSQTAAFSAIVSCLDSGRVAMFSALISEIFRKPNAGIVEASALDRDLGYHALVAVGHGTHQSERTILVRNSWGPAWGIFGHAWLTESYIATRICETAVINRGATP